MRFILAVIIFGILQLGDGDLERTYVRKFYPDGKLRSEGWIEDGTRQDYWYFYYSNGKVSKKGAYKNNRENGYWYFYSPENKLLAEGSFEDGLKSGWWKIYDNGFKKELKYTEGKIDGFVLIYEKGDLKKVERYSNDIKEGEWTSLIGFKRDNPNVKF